MPSVSLATIASTIASNRAAPSFLRELRRFLADIPEEEREQALTYYEDYFEDAGPENEQKVIQELGSPIDVAKQIKATNQENIAYGQGNDFQKDKAYPNVYESGRQAQEESHDDRESYRYCQNSKDYYKGNFGRVLRPAFFLRLIWAGAVKIGFANTLTMIGIGLILTCIGIFIFWIGILFCAKFFPAIFRAIGALCQSIAKWTRSLFNPSQAVIYSVSG